MINYVVKGQPRFHSFKHFDIENGLQNNIVFSATDDSKGFVWFATMTGIDRFDGNKFKSYKIPDDKSGSYDYIAVQWIFKDVKQQIWAITNRNLIKYDSNEDQFVQVSQIRSSLTNRETILSCHITSDQHIWLGMNNGVIFFDPLTNRSEKLKVNNLQVRAILQIEANKVLLGTNRGLFQASFDKNKILLFQQENWKVFNNVGVSVLSKDGEGSYWVGTFDRGVFQTNDLKGIFQPVSLPISLKHSFAVRDIWHDLAKKQHHLALDGGGVLVLDSNLKFLYQVLSDEDNPSSLSNNGVYDIFQDKHGTIWFTTYGGGVNYYQVNDQPFKIYRHQLNQKNSLSNNTGKCIATDPAGNLWFGTRKGLSRLNPKTNEWTHLNRENQGDHFPSDNILALQCTGKYLWAGTYGAGLVRIDLNDLSVKKYTSADYANLGTDFIYSLQVDREGMIWIGGIRGTMSVFDPKNEEFFKINLSAANVNCITQLKGGEICVGTEKGIYLMKRAGRNAVQGVTILANYPSFGRVLSIVESKDGHIWVSSQGNGIFKIDSKGEILRKISELDGLSSNIAYGVIEEDNGNLWVSTVKGLNHVMIESGKIVNYLQADGLAGSQYNHGSYLKLPSGELIFGSTNGFTSFHPDKIKIDKIDSKLVFTDLFLNERVVEVDSENGPLFKALDDLDKLVFPFHSNTFSVSFSNTSPFVSGKHLYSWKLEGFDSDWSPLTTASQAAYSRLSPGSYVLRVRTFAKGQSIQKPIERHINIVVQSPWYSTKSAYFVYVLLLILLVYATYHYFKIYTTRRKFAERLKLQTTIAHEIRTPLTLIKSPVDQILKKAELTSVQKESLQLASRNISRLEEIVSQFIDYQKVALDKVQFQCINVKFSDFLTPIINSFKDLAHQKDLTFTYENQVNDIYLQIDIDKMEKVFSNLLSNAIKYNRKNGLVAVVIQVTGQKLLISISDTGIGIPVKEQKYVFSGFYRAENTTNLKETGSGIGLSLSKELVELHQGTLKLESKEGLGSTFIVQLPLSIVGLTSPVEDVSATKAESGFKLLIVEDNDDLRRYFIMQLTFTGFDCLEASNGKDALEILKTHAVDLVITDVLMPKMNGFQLCIEIKNNMNTCHIPVIVLTTLGDRAYLLEGYRAGADDYVQKPFELDYVTARINSLLRNQIRFRTRILSVFDKQDNLIQENPDLEWLKKVTEHILEHMEDSNYTVELLSEKMGMSRSVLFRKFKLLTKESPLQYITQIRLRKAVELLQQNKFTVAEVAYKCGFSDPKYFSTAFKKHYGKSPKEYFVN